MNVWHKRVSELTSRLAEVEENLAKTQKELLKSQDTNSRLQRDLTENIAQKEDQVRLLEKQSEKNYSSWKWYNFTVFLSNFRKNELRS